MLANNRNTAYDFRELGKVFCNISFDFALSSGVHFYNWIINFHKISVASLVLASSTGSL